MHVDDIPSFPAYDPANMAAIMDALAPLGDDLEVYMPDENEAELIRIEDHFTMLLTGPVTKNMREELALALKAAYAFLDIGMDLKFTLGGWEKRVDQNQE